MYTITNEKVQKSIKSGLMAYKDMAKISLRKGGLSKKWKNLSLKDKVDAARSLVAMNAVAKSPEKFLSRSETESAWYARAKEYAKNTNIENIYYAFLIVQGPKELVLNKAEDALQQPLESRYYHFLKSIQDYEYAEEAWLKEKYGKEIIEKSNRIRKEVKIMKSNCVLRMVRQAFYDLQKTK